MNTSEILSWLDKPTFLALPRWGVFFFFIGLFVEYFLGKSKDPRFRSLASSIAVLLSTIVTPTIGRFPVLGPIIKNILNIIAPNPVLEPATEKITTTDPTPPTS